MVVVHDEKSYNGYIVAVHNTNRPSRPIVSAALANPSHIFADVFSTVNMHTILQ